MFEVSAREVEAEDGHLSASEVVVVVVGRVEDAKRSTAKSDSDLPWRRVQLGVTVDSRLFNSVIVWFLQTANVQRGSGEETDRR